MERFRFTRLDRLIAASIAVIALLIGGTLALGDRVGVSIERVAPLGEARSTDYIRIAFNEVMNRESVQTRLRTEPALTGDSSWNGRTLTFRPSGAMAPGGAYTVILESGATSESGRVVLSEYRYQFTVRRPRVAYLYPADDFPQNIWIADPRDLANPQQLTNSPSGIYDFAVSPDGSQIAFAENNTDATVNIKLIDLETGALTQLTNCPDSACTSPIWRPDGQIIAYERVDFNSALQDQGVSNSPTRTWLLDLSQSPPTTRPLFEDGQILGFNAQWSADGSRIAVFDAGTGSIIIYDFAENNLLGIESRAGQSGALAPNGRQLVFPEISFQENQSAVSYMRIADLDTGGIAYISTPDQGVDDQRAEWRPDGEAIVVARRNENVIRGSQLWLIDVNAIAPDGGILPEGERLLTDDPRYSTMLFEWSPTGDALVMQSFPELDENGNLNNLGRPEIWTLDVATGERTQIAVNGLFGHWVP